MTVSTIDLQILQAKLNAAAISGDLQHKRVALDHYLQRTQPLVLKHDAMFSSVAMQHGVCATKDKYSIYGLSETVVDFHLLAAQKVITDELKLRAYEFSGYSRAVTAIFAPARSFTANQTLYVNSHQQELSVEDLLKVSKYSIAVAEIMAPDDPNIELASAAVTVFQGIEASLNNQQQPMTISKRLHLANGFLSTVVKSMVKDKDTKRGITVTSTLIDLAIDFFCGR